MAASTARIKRFEEMQPMKMVSVRELTLHPEAQRVPMMPDDQYAAFLADVCERNIRVALEVIPGTTILLDGRCRLQAAKDASIEEVPVVEANLNGNDPILYMMRAASKRRHWTDDQRAMMARTEEEWIAEKNKQERATKGGRAGGKGRKKDSSEMDVNSKLSEVKSRARKQAAENHGVSQHKVQQARIVAQADKALAEDVAQGKMKLAQAVREIKRKEKRQAFEKKAKEGEKRTRALKRAGKLLWDIRCGDCLVELDSIKPESVDLIFADPPYNFGVDYGPGANADRLPDAVYLDWCRAWMSRCAEKMIAAGSFWVLICDEYASECAQILKYEMKLTIRAWIKWYETFGVNNSAENNFNRCSRHLFHCVKDPDHCTFNEEAVRRPSDRQEKYNDARADPAGKILDDVWIIPRLVGTAKERIDGFPTQLPLELLRRVIGCASNPGQLVLDPFSGSGTSGEAAIRAGRRYLGIEKQKNFVELSRLRLTAASALDAPAVDDCRCPGPQLPTNLVS
jgi:site-specific DNA-methyltransferase (adenine-specific)